MSDALFKHRLEFAAFRLFIGLAKLLGLERASAAMGRLARFAGPRVGVSRRARRNLARVLPEIAPSERETVIADMWENLGRTFAEYPFLGEFRAYEPGGHITVRGTENFEKVQALGKGAIFFSGHFANWELMPMAVQQWGLEGGEVYRAANNPLVNDWITAMRSAHVMRTQVPKGAAGARAIVNLLKQHKHIAMLADQKMNDGIKAKFFGIDAMCPAAPAQLALKYNCPLVPVHIVRSRGTQFEITIWPPLDVAPSGDRQADMVRITEAINDFLEARIRETPSQWLWLHNRWPD